MQNPSLSSSTYRSTPVEKWRPPDHSGSSSVEWAFLTLQSHLMMRAFLSTMEVCVGARSSTTSDLRRLSGMRRSSTSLQILRSSGESRELQLSRRCKSVVDRLHWAFNMGSSTLLSSPISLKNFSRSALLREYRALNSERSELFEYRLARSDLERWMAFLTRLLTAASACSSLTNELLLLRPSISELVSVRVSLHSSPASMVGMGLLWGSLLQSFLPSPSPP